MKKILIFVFILLLPFIMNAQEANSNLEDELFGGNEDVLISEEDVKSKTKSQFQFKADLEKATIGIENNKFKIGGSFSSSLGLSYLWEDPYKKKDDYLKSFYNAKRVLRTRLEASLFFDARPKENLKLYGKFIFGVPFEIPLNNDASIPNFKIQELYTDFSAKDIAFFRFGKHAVKWGTGYFYSPADVINISGINIEDPTADREGAVSLRTHIIIPKTQHNIWLYLLPPTPAENFDPKYTAGAIKAEFVFGNWEMGIGGWYKYEKAPRFVTTLSGSIAGKVAVFAEGVFAWGSDYTYYKDNINPYKSSTEKNKPFFQATLGGSYSNSDTHTSIRLQYYYNGFGYTNTDMVKSILNEADQAIKNKDYTHRAIMPSRNISAMRDIGQHYIVFLLTQSKIGTDKLSASLFQQFAISERQGFSKLTLNWNIYKFASMSTGPSFTYPISTDSKEKGSIGYSLTFTLGGGKF